MNSWEAWALYAVGYVSMWLGTEWVCYLRWRKRKIKKMLADGHSADRVMHWYNTTHSNQNGYVGDKDDHEVGAFLSGMFWPVTWVVFTLITGARTLGYIADQMVKLTSKGAYTPPEPHKPDYKKIDVLEGEIFPQDRRP